MPTRTKRTSAALDFSKIERAFVNGLQSPQPEISSAEFADAVDHADEAWCRLFPDFERIETEWNASNPEGALLAALVAIGKVARINFMLATALTTDKKMISTGVKQREGKRQYDIEQQIERSKRIRLAAKLWSEFDPADVKGKTKEVWKEIGEIMRRRLELVEPIKPETVKDYLKDYRRMMQKMEK